MAYGISVWLFQNVLLGRRKYPLITFLVEIYNAGEQQLNGVHLLHEMVTAAFRISIPVGVALHAREETFRLC